MEKAACAPACASFGGRACYNRRFARGRGADEKPVHCGARTAGSRGAV